MTALARKDRVRLVWPGGELDGREGTVRRVIRTRKASDGATGYIVRLDKPDSRGQKTIHVFENRIEPIDGSAR